MDGNRDYAAALTPQFKKWFWEPLCLGEIPASFCSWSRILTSKA